MKEETNKMMALAGIKENDKKFLKNESFLENTKDQILKESMGDITPEEWDKMHSAGKPIGCHITNIEPSSDTETKSDDDFIVMEFDQEEVEPGPDDEKLYKIN